MGKKRILSGMRPTGRLHLGHLVGALTNWVKLQDDYQCFYMIADLHALTDRTDTSKIKDDVKEIVIDWLSSGISEQKCVIFRQSEVKEHSELHLLLSMVTPVSWLERCPTYKERIAEMKLGGKVSYGLLGYPVLQAADILVYKAEAVPVGEDQVPHLEMTREIARRFNHLFGKVFPEPQPILTKIPKLLGLDNRKMSKSYNNYIALADPSEVIRKKVQSMITDPARAKREDLGHPDICNVYSYHKVFNKPEVSKIGEECRKAGIGCTECKDNLSSRIIESLKDLRLKRKELEKKPQVIEKILAEGRQRAGETAGQTLREVKSAMKI
jgi:tryptophanyl-tRNA synthetase